MSDVRTYACLSEDGRYRYWLSRHWGPSMRAAVFVMLNPSKADAHKDDPTIRRCVKFARTWGYDALHVVNLYGYRATDPTVLKTVSQPIGPENDEHLIKAADLVRAHDGILIAAWGNHATLARVEMGTAMLGDAPLHCLGTTQSGAPKHPLARGIHRIPDDVTPQPWPATDRQGVDR